MYVASRCRAPTRRWCSDMSLVDGVGRSIDYLRLSVTDRCDFRCVYCMAKNMTFLPRQQVLTLEELQRLATVFVSQVCARSA
jgi:cyclic pyranopterin phosphate synthase